MKLARLDCNITHLHEHLQYAVDLELWTIPFYMSAMYSIKDRSSTAYQMIRTVVNQEMLHLQSAANICNAFGYSPAVTVPVYDGTTIPHLNIALDSPEATRPYMPYTTNIGSLDQEHINAMCLIELPEFEAHEGEINLYTSTTEYGTIGAFYQALSVMVGLHKNQIRGGVRQVDFFAPFYRNAPELTVTESQSAGLSQVNLLIQLITDQGEGVSKQDPTVPKVFQNTADDNWPEMDHFEKFSHIKNNPSGLPATYSTVSPASYNEEQKQLQQICIDSFGALTELLQSLFSGENPGQFFPVMAGAGAAISNCWQNGVVPAFGTAASSATATTTQEKGE